MGILSTYNYASPQGEDCLYKTAHSTKAGAVLGAYIASFDIIGMTKPKGFYNISYRLLQYVLPTATAGALLSSTACISAHLRGKDDMWNQFLGGGVGGFVLGAATGKPGNAAVLCVLGAIATEFVWAAKQETILSQTREPISYFRSGTLGHHKRFYGPRIEGWTTGPEEPKNY